MSPEARWAGLCGRLGVHETRAASIWREIAAGYGEPHRHYHTMAHIAAVTADCERLSGQFEQPDAARLGLFFHDIVYDPARSDNEARSADRLRDLLEHEIDGDTMSVARRHILETRHHRRNDHEDTNLVLDIDMAILGAPWPDYRAYAEGVYREYLPAYGHDAYAQGRVALFLTPVLERAPIFLTSAFANYEDQARRNLDAERTLWLTGQFMP